jgi:RpiB/LacA/LacB family sugar-phosphate isomerase
MRIVIGADHAGFSLKDHLIELLREEGHSVLNVGTDGSDPVDYPDYAQAVGEAVLSGKVELGLLLCGSGVGASIAANKIRGIRAALCHDVYSAHQCREHDDANVLCLGPRVIGVKLAEELVRAFLIARFSGAERHRRRLDKVARLEER